MNYKYTHEQIEFLREGYQTMSAKDLTKYFNANFGTNKTFSAIRTILVKRKIKTGRSRAEYIVKQSKIFNAEQESFIRREYKKRPISELTSIFNDYFGTSFTCDQIKSFIGRLKIICGRTGCYKKGNSPWNTGTKGKRLTGANKRSFKKGNIPPNRKPLGFERISKDGFIEIKVAERNPNTGFPTRYKHKQRHVWECNFGPIPKGKIIAFKDSDPINCEPENLMLVSRAELLSLNRNKYKKMPMELKPSIVALSKLQVKTSAVSRDHKETIKPEKP